MNCKEGDLAMIVKSYAGNEGKIVRCVSFVGEKTLNVSTGTELFNDVWCIDRKLVGFRGRLTNYFRDSQLRPIKDSEKEDEMLRLIGKPETTELKF